jgi:hypothetical protein
VVREVFAKLSSDQFKMNKSAIADRENTISKNTTKVDGSAVREVFAKLSSESGKKWILFISR